MLLRDLLNDATSQLSLITDVPRLEAEVLLATAMQKPRSYLFSHPEKLVDYADENHFKVMLSRRLRDEPLAYITGEKEFWSLPLHVTADTLIPRPETEMVVSQALSLLPEAGEVTVADLGTGSGAIALALASERVNWRVLATDNHANTIAIARQNALTFGLTNVTFCLGDWCQALPQQKIHMIVSNPPYLAETEWKQYAGKLSFEPRVALVSGEDGMRALHTIITTAKHYLVLGGYVVLEHGFSQGEAVRALFAEHGYDDVLTLCDMAGHERITRAKFG